MKLSGRVVVFILCVLASVALMAGAGLIHMKTGAQREGLRSPAATSFALDAERRVEIPFRALRTGEYDVVLSLDAGEAGGAGRVWPEVEFSLETTEDAPATRVPEPLGSEDSSRRILGAVVTMGGDAYRLVANVRPTPAMARARAEIRLEIGDAARERIERDTDEDWLLATVLSFAGAIGLAGTVTVWVAGTWRTRRKGAAPPP